MPSSYIGDAFLDLQFQASSTGPGTPLFIDPYGGAVLAVTGTFVASIVPEATLDRQNWFSVEALNLATGGKTTSITSPGLYVVAAPGGVLLRARIDSYTSGSVTVSGRPVVVAEVLPSVGSGSGGTSAEVQIRDGDAAGEARVLSSAPSGSEAGLVVRNIPSGTQTVSGAVTADTELPAAAALADGAANPTTPTAGSATLIFNGSTWDRARGDTTNGLDVDVTRVQGNVTVVQSTAANLQATVTGTVTANQGGTWSVVDAGAAKTLKRAVVSLTATGTVIAAVSGRRLKVYQYALQSRNDSMTVRFRDGSAGGNLGLEWSLNAREGVSSGPVNPPAFLFGTTAGNALDAVVSGTGTVWVEVSYWDDDTS